MIPTMHARVAVLVAVAAALATAGCGGGNDRRTSTPTGSTGGQSTAPAQPNFPALEETGRPADTAAVRVIRGWTDAQRASDVERATSYFTVPALVENGTVQELDSRAAVRAFNAGLPCGAVLLRTSASARRGFTVATFRLVNRPGQRCDGSGNQARTAFEIHAGKIRGWVRLTDRRSKGGGAPQPAPSAPQPNGSSQSA
jgi:hypothetical protein